MVKQNVTILYYNCIRKQYKCTKTIYINIQWGWGREIGFDRLTEQNKNHIKLLTIHIFIIQNWEKPFSGQFDSIAKN